MTMSPPPWPRNPETVSQDFDVRHGAGTLRGTRSATPTCSLSVRRNRMYPATAL